MNLYFRIRKIQFLNESKEVLIEYVDRDITITIYFHYLLFNVSRSNYRYYRFLAIILIKNKKKKSS